MRIDYDTGSVPVILRNRSTQEEKAFTLQPLTVKLYEEVLRLQDRAAALQKQIDKTPSDTEKNKLYAQASKQMLDALDIMLGTEEHREITENIFVTELAKIFLAVRDGLLNASQSNLPAVKKKSSSGRSKKK